jgi:tetratricopeptide (TPR) repeat protein
MLLVATARPDFVDARAGWGSGRYDAETIWLDPLASNDAGTMLASLLGSDLPGSTRDLIVRRAEGNPLFIEELLGSLIDQGTIERANGTWRVRDLDAGVEIPDTVQAVVAARLDLLQPSEKAALQAASVVGRIFWTGPVYDLIEDEPDLRVLEDRDFIRRRGGSSLEGEREFAFKHAITRDVAYDSVPKSRRARLHAAFAEWIERRSGDRDEMASMLAHHYSAAVSPDVADLAWDSDAERLSGLTLRARRWLRRAADLAFTRYELDDSVSLYEQALALGPDRSEEVQLWLSLGRVHAIRYDGMEMWNAMQRAIHLCEDRTTLGELYAELSVETTDRWGMWSQVPDEDMVQGWIDRALELTVPGTAARAKALSALCFWNLEDSSWAVDELDELTRSLGDPWLRILALHAAWLNSFVKGDFRGALEIARQAYALEAGTNDPNVGAELRESSFTLFILCGQPEEIRRLLAEHDLAVERLSAHHRLHGVALWMEFHEVTADWDAVRSLIPRTRAAVADNLSTPCVRNTRSLLICAAACAALGDQEEARALEREAVSIQPEGYDVILQGPRIRLALAQGDLEAVRDLSDHANIGRRHLWTYAGTVAAYLDAVAALRDLDRAERDAPQFLGSRSVLEAFAMRTLGVVRADRSLLEEAAALFARLGFEQQSANTRSVM